VAFGSIKSQLKQLSLQLVYHLQYSAYAYRYIENASLL